MSCLDLLLNNNHFKAYLDNAPNTDNFVLKLKNGLESGKIDLLIDTLSKTLDEDDMCSSLLVNLTADYNKIISRLPDEFTLSESDVIHVGYSNQLDIDYRGSISPKARWCMPLRLACVSFYFIESKNDKTLVLESIQGDCRSGSSSNPEINMIELKEIHRLFGKLNTFYGTDWRPGLLQQVHDYGKENGMNVKGEIPGIFYFLSSSMPQYPTYALNHLRTYLNIGLSLDDIRVSTMSYISEEMLSRWEKTFSFLKTKSDKDKILLIDKAADLYTKQYMLNRNACFYGQKMGYDAYEKNCEDAYKEIFSEVFS